MNRYEQRQEARRQRYLDRADAADSEATRRFKQSGEGLPPMGEPIKIGHHSEKRHRAAIERSHTNMRKGVEAHHKAEHYRRRADGVGRAGISSDDPEALVKLREKLAKREATQAYMRAANRPVRAAYKRGLRHDSPGQDLAPLQQALKDATDRDHSEAEVRGLLTPDFANRIGFADYQLSNNSAEIRRIKKRIAGMEAAAQQEPADDLLGDGWKIVENVEENRLQIFFDEKPSQEIRDCLKIFGFRWSRTNQAWQRHLNNGARHAARAALGID